MYEVIQYFTDLQDNNHPYGVGDTFPRNGFTVSQERLDELASDKNRRNIPLIKKVEDKVENKVDENFGMNPPEEPKEETKTYKKSDITLMKVEDLKSLATELGINEANKKSGSELKKLIIKKLGL